MGTFRWQMSLINDQNFNDARTAFAMTAKRKEALDNGDPTIDYIQAYFEGNALCRFLGASNPEMPGNAALGVGFTWRYHPPTQKFHFQAASFDSQLQQVSVISGDKPDSTAPHAALQVDNNLLAISADYTATVLLQSLGKSTGTPVNVTLHAIVRVANGSDKLFFNLAMQKAGNSTEYLLGLACPPFHYPNI